MTEDKKSVSVFSAGLVLIQFGCLGYLFTTGQIFQFSSYTIILELFSILLALWSVFVMRESKLNIFPDVKRGSKLIRKGPYRSIRHPMYLAVILFALSLVLNSYNEIRLLVFLLLIIDLIIKIEYEENLLKLDLQGYTEYRLRTYKLIPYLY